jgi:hypothetical protein
MPTAQCGFHDATNGLSGQQALVTWGPTLSVDIGFDSTLKAEHKAVPNPGVRGLHALVDTGATESCIDSLLAARLNLPIVDRRPIGGAHGAQA